MKHESLFPVDNLRQRDLPDAPLRIQRQVIEHRQASWFGLARLWFMVLGRS